MSKEKSTWWKLQEPEPELFRPYIPFGGMFSEHRHMRSVLSSQDYSKWLDDKVRQQTEERERLYWDHATKLDYKKSDKEDIFVLQCQTCEQVVSMVDADSFGIKQEEIRQHSVKQYKKHYRIRHSRWRRVR